MKDFRESLVLTAILVLCVGGLIWASWMAGREDERMFEMTKTFEMSVTRTNWPATTTQIGQAGRVSIYLVKYRNAEFVVTSAGEIMGAK